MHFGQYFTSTARKEHTCTYKECLTGKTITFGEYYVGLIIRRKNSKPFMQEFHKECFFLGTEEQEKHRKELIKEKRKAPRPYRVLRLEPELAARKKILVHKLSVTKAQLMLAYLNSNSKNITRNKETLVKVLTELNLPEFERPYHWRFGDNLIKQLATGVDPLISGEAAQKADRGNFSEAIRLLAQESALPVPVNYEVNSDLIPIREEAANILRNSSDKNLWKKQLLGLAAFLEIPQALFDDSGKFNEAILYRTDVCSDIGSRPATFEDYDEAKKANATLVVWLREIADRLPVESE